MKIKPPDKLKKKVVMNSLIYNVATKPFQMISLFTSGYMTCGMTRRWHEDNVLKPQIGASSCFSPN